MDTEKYKAKYSTGADGLSFEVEKLVNDHNSWFKSSEIRATPSFVINGYKLPGQYRIEDLRYLVVGISEQVPVAGEKMREAEIQ